MGCSCRAFVRTCKMINHHRAGWDMRHSRAFASAHGGPCPPCSSSQASCARIRSSRSGSKGKAKSVANPAVSRSYPGRLAWCLAVTAEAEPPHPQPEVPGKLASRPLEDEVAPPHERVVRERLLADDAAGLLPQHAQLLQLGLICNVPEDSEHHRRVAAGSHHQCQQRALRCRLTAAAVAGARSS